MDTWKKHLVDEEVSELEEDLMVSASYLPFNLMTKLETWGEKVLYSTEFWEQNFVSRLLTWFLCLEFLDGATLVNARNRSCIISYLGKTGVIKFIFEMILSQINLLEYPPSDLISSIPLNSTKKISKNNLSTLVLFRTIESLPTLCKIWWMEECSRTQRTIIKEFIEKWVAPITLRRELERIHKSNRLTNIEIHGSCVSREVTATYVQDECQLSMLIRIPICFPLKNVEVDCKKTLGISEKQGRHWSLQIMRMLNHEDGCILDALLFWKKNVDKHFDGVEPCPVCYSVICMKTHSIPNLECKICQNRFHCACLYKWFRSSGKTQCVICQQSWSGTKTM